MGTPFAAMGSEAVTFAKSYRTDELRSPSRPVRRRSGSHRHRLGLRARIRRRLVGVTRTAPYPPHHPSLQEWT